jgi:hypothetical protein
VEGRLDAPLLLSLISFPSSRRSSQPPSKMASWKHTAMDRYRHGVWLSCTRRERYRERSSESLINKGPLNVSWCFSFAYLLASAPTYTASLLASLHSSTIRPQIIIGEARVAGQDVTAIHGKHKPAISNDHLDRIWHLIISHVSCTMVLSIPSLLLRA